MRELKFRAWDKDTKRYWNVGGLGFEKGRLIEVYLDNYPTTLEGNEECKKPDEVILEQYTGLKDKNDKEIYEGDIVEIYKGGATYEVAWFEKYGGWFCFSNNDDHYEPLYQADFEVIGNIHENKELLEGEK